MQNRFQKQALLALIQAAFAIGAVSAYAADIEPAGETAAAQAPTGAAAVNEEPAATARQEQAQAPATPQVLAQAPVSATPAPAPVKAMPKPASEPNQANAGEASATKDKAAPTEAKEGQQSAAPQARFIVNKGSGSSKTVSKAPQVKLPEGPLGKAPENINKLLAEAQSAGGIQLDPVQREINMPGLKKDDPSLKPFVLHTRNGVNEIVKMSSRLLNRVATPFKKPIIIDTSESVSKIVGSDVYFMPTGDQPIGLFIADSANTSQTVSLTVIPDDAIPGQNLIVKLEDLRTVKSLTGATAAETQIAQPKANDYTSMVRSLLASAAKGTVPGFTPVPLEGGVARMDDLSIEPELTFAGSVADIYRYRLSNVGSEPIDLVETAFFRAGVKAVSFFPRTSLKPGEQSHVFILADKPQSDAQGDQQ